MTIQRALELWRQNSLEENFFPIKSVIFAIKIVSCQKYKYFGMIFLFYSNEHEPVHVHGRYQNKESKAEIIYEDGKFLGIRIAEVKGKEPLDPKKMKKFRKIVELYREDIVRKWIDFFVYNIEIQPEKITKKV